MEPVSFNKWLEFAAFALIHFIKAFQIGSGSKTGLNITVTIHLDTRSVSFPMVIRFDPHPGNLRLRLNIPLINGSFAAREFANFKGISLFQQMLSDLWIYRTQKPVLHL